MAAHAQDLAATHPYSLKPKFLLDKKIMPTSPGGLLIVFVFRLLMLITLDVR